MLRYAHTFIFSNNEREASDISFEVYATFAAMQEPYVVVMPAGSAGTVFRLTEELPVMWHLHETDVQNDATNRFRSNVRYDQKVYIDVTGHPSDVQDKRFHVSIVVSVAMRTYDSQLALARCYRVKIEHTDIFFKKNPKAAQALADTPVTRDYRDDAYLPPSGPLALYKLVDVEALRLAMITSGAYERRSDISLVVKEHRESGLRFLEIQNLADGAISLAGDDIELASMDTRQVLAGPRRYDPIFMAPSLVELTTIGLRRYRGYIDALQDYASGTQWMPSDGSTVVDQVYNRVSLDGTLIIGAAR